MSVSEERGSRHEVRLDSGSIAYRERGAGDPIVFVHPIFTNGDLWRDVVPSLAEQYRCITPDWPLGSHSVRMDRDADLSPPGLADLVGGFLDALDLHDVTLVGNDTGGAISQLVVARHPERVARLVLVSCDAFEVFPPRLFAYLKLTARMPGGVFLAAQSLRWRLLRRLPITYGWLTHAPLDREAGDSYVRPLARHRDIRRDAKKVVRGLHPRHMLAAAERFGAFDRPALVVWGEDDRVFPRSLGERLAYALPRARLKIVAGARTLVSEDRPAQLAGMIRDFMAGTDLSAPAPPATASA
ncbi:MAG: alpha/beta hydrolase [Actinobacteria bacterium]|nr:alpha/beta hydrolase [Actinomycetota bacterium]